MQTFVYEDSEFELDPLRGFQPVPLKQQQIERQADSRVNHRLQPLEEGTMPANVALPVPTDGVAVGLPNVDSFQHEAYV